MTALALAPSAHAAPTLQSVVGADPPFAHDADVSDVFPAGDELLVLAGCAVTRWSATGERLSVAALEGCSAGMNHGFFSPDGRFVANAGWRVGDSGVWPVTGGRRAVEADGIQWGTLCGGAWWDLPAEGGLRRVDLATGRARRPLGDERASTVCVDDQWLVTSDGKVLDLDGTLGGEVPRGTVLGTTGDGRALVWGDDRVRRVARDGTEDEVAWLPDAPEFVTPAASGGWVAGFAFDVAWRLDAAGRPVEGPLRADAGGLSRRAAQAGSVRWRGRDWAWCGRRVFPLAAAVGPTDTSSERVFFGGDALWTCSGASCEAHDLAHPEAPARTVALPTSLGSDDGVSPSGRFLALGGSDRVLRVDLDTGVAETLHLPDQWPDDVVVDDAGAVRYLLADDPDDDDRWRHEVFAIDGATPRSVATWTSREVADLGQHVDGLDERRLRWPAASVDLDGAGDWRELSGGLVAVWLDHGGALRVYGPDGAPRFELDGPFDTWGRWGQGLWTSRGPRVELVDAAGGRVATFEVPWLEGEGIEGWGSGDGRWFGARRPDGAVAVWRTGEGAPAAPVAAPAPWTTVPPRLVAGRVYGAPAIPTPTRMGDDWAYVERDLAFAAALHLWYRAPDEELRRELEGVIRANFPSDEEAYAHREQFFDALPAVRPGDHRPTAPGLEVVPHRPPKEARREVDAYAFPAREPGPLFGVAGCPGAFPAVPPLPNPAGPLAPREGERLVTLVVAVSPEGAPAWVAMDGDDGVGAASACWAHASSGPWTPARDASGTAVPACVVHRCRFASDRLE